jgi:hypothetical protein
MKCFEAQPYVSALYDGEQILEEAASHINGCPNCRSALREYAEIGAEIRLLANLHSAVSPPAGFLEQLHNERRSRWRFFAKGIWVPRFVFIAFALGLLAIVPAGWTILHAQNRFLWFQFNLQPFEVSGNSTTYVARPGYNEEVSWLFGANQGHDPTVVGARIKVKSIEANSVRIEIAARSFGNGRTAPVSSHEELAKLTMRTFWYSPGRDLNIPVAGGGALILRGSIVDHQPKIAWGHPLEPNPGELILSSPILTEGKRVVVDLSGATTSLQTDSEVVRLYSPEDGLFLIGLRSFPGAVEGEATWGRLTFKLEDKQYTLVAGSPICGGDQPHPVWIALDHGYTPPSFGRNGFLGSAPLNGQGMPGS